MRSYFPNSWDTKLYLKDHLKTEKAKKLEAYYILTINNQNFHMI